MTTLLREHPDGKRCYLVPTRGHGCLAKSGLFTFALPTRRLTTKQYLGGFLPYTGSWYLYDIETGEEVASMPNRGGAWQVLVEPHRICDLVEDSEC
jgi:hypothetical protein